MQLPLGGFLVFGALLSALPCTASEGIINGQGVGDLLIGQVLPPLQQHRVLFRNWQFDENGGSYELVRVKVGEVPVDAEIYDGAIWRISINLPGLSTRDGVQVGDKMATLIRKNRSLDREIGPGPSLVLIPRNVCGISYMIDSTLLENTHGKLNKVIPGESIKNFRISRIYVVGCEK